MSASEDQALLEPFIIHHVEGKYLIFETKTLRHLREVHHICGVLIGTLPQISQQNVFLGLPQEIMVEEAAYLVRHGHAYVVDDRRVHSDSVAAITPDQLARYQRERADLRRSKEAAAREVQMRRKREVLEEKGLAHLLETPPSISHALDDTAHRSKEFESRHVPTCSHALIYRPPPPPPPSRLETSTSNNSVSTSQSSLSRWPARAVEVPADLATMVIQPNPVDARYHLFSHLHERGYFLTPGLRFGAQFVAYPGDPLRFHSHFVASGHDWHAPIRVMDVVAGGRLGTGVKKAWLIGAKRPPSSSPATAKSDDERNGREDQGGDGEMDGEVECFTIEWAGM